MLGVVEEAGHLDRVEQVPVAVDLAAEDKRKKAEIRHGVGSGGGAREEGRYGGRAARRERHFLEIKIKCRPPNH